MTSALDGGVRQPLGARHFFQEFDFATLRYRIVIGEGTKEGFFKALEKLPSLALLFEPRRRRQCGNLTGHRPRPHLVARVREGSLVGDRNGRWQGRRHAKLVQQQLEQLHGQCRRRKHHGHHKTYRQIDGLPAPLLPVGEFTRGVSTFTHTANRFLHLRQAGRRCIRAESLYGGYHLTRHIGIIRQSRVGDDHTVKAFRVIHHQTQADQTTPVLTEKSDAGKIICFQPIAHPLNLTLITVIFSCRRFIGSAITHHVRSDHAHARSGQMGNDVPIQITPNRLAVHTQHDRTLYRALVQMMNPKVSAVVCLYGGVMRREWIIDQTFKALVRGSQYLHCRTSSFNALHYIERVCP